MTMQIAAITIVVFVLRCQQGFLRTSNRTIRWPRFIENTKLFPCQSCCKKSKAILIIKAGIEAHSKTNELTMLPCTELSSISACLYVIHPGHESKKISYLQSVLPKNTVVSSFRMSNRPNILWIVRSAKIWHLGCICNPCAQLQIWTNSSKRDCLKMLLSESGMCTAGILTGRYLRRLLPAAWPVHPFGWIISSG